MRSCIARSKHCLVTAHAETISLTQTGDIHEPRHAACRTTSPTRSDNFDIRGENLYDQIDRTLISLGHEGWVRRQDGRWKIHRSIQSILLSPAVVTGFLAFMKANSEHTTLSHRVQEVIILSVGAIWQSKYELYAHSALARKADLSEEALQHLRPEECPVIFHLRR